MFLAVGSVIAFGTVRHTQIDMKPLPPFPEAFTGPKLPLEAALLICVH